MFEDRGCLWPNNPQMVIGCVLASPGAILNLQNYSTTCVIGWFELDPPRFNYVDSPIFVKSVSQIVPVWFSQLTTISVEGFPPRRPKPTSIIWSRLPKGRVGWKWLNKLWPGSLGAKWMSGEMLRHVQYSYTWYWYITYIYIYHIYIYISYIYISIYAYMI